MAQGKIYLPSHNGEKPSSSKWPIAILAGVLLGLVLFTSPVPLVNNVTVTSEDLKKACYQPEPSLPTGFNTSKVLDQKDRIIEWLAGAVSGSDGLKCVRRLIGEVRIRTESYDDAGDLETDPRWDNIRDLHKCMSICAEVITDANNPT